MATPASPRQRRRRRGAIVVLRMGMTARTRHLVLVAVLALLVATVLPRGGSAAPGVLASRTYRPEVVGRVGVVAAGRHFAAEAGMRMLVRGGNAVDAGVAATFAAAVSEISHFGLGGEVPIIVHRADRGQTFVINGQGTAPAAASADFFRKQGGIPPSGPLAGAVPAVVDALCIALAEFGTLSLEDTLAPAIELADGFPWYELLTYYMRFEYERVATMPSGARVYLPGGAIPEIGSIFRQPELAATLRRLVAAEQSARGRGRAAAIEAAREEFYRGDVARRIAEAVQKANGLLTAADLAAYRGRTEAPTHATFRTPRGAFEVFKTGFWGQGPTLLQALQILGPLDLAGMGHNSAAYIHTVTEALKLALADRDAFYGDPDAVRVPARGLLSDPYATERRRLIDPAAANNEQRPGEPWRFEPHASTPPRPVRISAALADRRAGPSPDTTTIDVADRAGNLFSASPSSAWFFGGVFIAGDTGVPLGNRMQAFVLDEGHPNVVAGGKRPRTTLSPTVVLRDGKPFLALSSPGGDSQEQQALQVFLNIAVFNMRPQEAIEAPRFNSLHHEESFGDHGFQPAGLEVEDRIPAGVVEALRRLGHKVEVLGPFMMN